MLGVIDAGVHQFPVRATEQADPTSPVVILLPAMGVRASYYRPFIENLSRQGLTVVGFDFRGHGENRPRAARGVRFGYQDLVDDVADVVDLVSKHYPDAPRFLVGHSLGGQITMLYTASHPGRVQGAAVLASGSVWWRTFPGAQGVKNLVGTQLIAAMSTLLGYWPGWVFGGRQATGLMCDWARQGRTGRWALDGSTTDYEKALGALRLPLLTVSVDGDEFAPPSSMDHLAGKARQATRTRRHYGLSDAGADKLGHFGWVHRSAELSRWIGDWLASSADGVGRLGHVEPEPRA
ncbi:alpha/beta fold hydrolase [Saccharopolyspora taberi]|uniref:Alpha/beta fold hydrolase n=2 Tax=Saccharopolyspora taberi TaxID=60895 RepID=A0ABN3VH27_9PSEU